MGLEINYFYSLLPREFYNILIGYRQKEENNFKTSWEQTRLIAFHSAFTFESKDKEVTPEKFKPLPWDEEQPTAKKATRTREEMKAMFKKLDEETANRAVE